MAYDEALAHRIRKALYDRHGVTEKRMFGGIAFLLHGHMFVGIVDSALMARVGPTEYKRALSMKHVREMDFTGKPLRGYVFVDPKAVTTARRLKSWVHKCASFADTLPRKRTK